MAKTKWIISKDQIILYPNKVLYIFGIVLTIAFLALGYYVSRELHGSSVTMITYLLLFSAAPLIMFVLAAQKIVFDRINQKMYVRIFGGLNLRVLHFSNIAVIQPVYQYGSGFNFQVFRKSNRHGKGIRISAGYSKDTDENAMAMTAEVFPLISAFLDEAPGNEVLEEAPITSYNFYTIDQHTYKLKRRFGILIIVGVACVAWGIYALLKVDLTREEHPILMTWLPIIFGLFLLLASTNRVQFDTDQQLIRSTLIGGLRKREYPFAAFNGFSIVRKTTNFVYSGTEVSMKLENAKTGKIDGLLLQSFTRTKKIELLLRETESILSKKI